MSEQELTIEKARLSFKSFIMVSGIRGLCLGLFALVVNSIFDLFGLATGDPNTHAVGLLINFMAIITGPITGLLTGIVSYPFYKWLLNKKFSMSITVYTLEPKKDSLS